MRKLYLQFILLVLFTSTAIAQNVKNMDLIDSRAKKHYSEEQILEMPYYKVMQVNFYYSSSFFIETPKSSLCPVIDAKQVDITKYSANRDARKRNHVGETEQCLNIVLLSWEEIQAEYDKIKRQYINQ
ncbi:MAG: hypothetical protein WCK02_10475 [Bacteroidota bacterium]